NEGEEEHAVGGLGEGEAHVEGELAAVPPEPRQLEALPHRAAERAGRITVPVPDVIGPELLGNETLHGLAEQFVARVSEQRERACVHRHDAALRVGDDDGLERRLEQGAGALLALSQGFLSALLIRLRELELGNAGAERVRVVPRFWRVRRLHELSACRDGPSLPPRAQSRMRTSAEVTVWRSPRKSSTRRRPSAS